ncbi:MAG TPA: hypothetical protein DCZ48_13530 [Methylococcaceae bacterium]|nr:hypothetical protein [Methylococcaceae bacterium]
MSVSKSCKLSITGAETENHQVSIETMAQVLTGIQKTVYLLASAKLKQPLQQRFVPSREIKSLYTLQCGIPEPGSYVIPLAQLEPLSPLEETPILEDLTQLLSAVGAGLQDKLYDLLPDSRYREKVLRELLRYLPKPGSRWGLSFMPDGQPAINLESKAIRTVEHWLVPADETDTVMTVTGELIRIDFDRNLVALRYPPTNRELECSYVQDIEDSIIESRRELIQVTGRFTLDADGHPKSLTDVTRIEPVDLSALTFETVDLNGRQLTLSPPLVLEPALDEESKQLLVVSDDILNIHVYAQTREQLADDLVSELFFLWDEYAHEDSDNLTPKARQLQENLLRRCKESDNDATR